VQKLVCELCGSNDFTKDNEGYFVCDYCRTKYTPEQAKSMIVEGTVRVDRSGEAASLLTLAGTALSGGNMQEALDYANRALEINPEDSTAWYLKGTATGWLSTIQQPRLAELRHAYTLAIQKASEADHQSVVNWCSDGMNQIAGAQTWTSINNVRQYPTASGIWMQHTNLAAEALGLLMTSYQWRPNPASLTISIAIASDLINGVPYQFATEAGNRSGQHRTAPDYREYLQEQINWAGDQMRHFDPSFVAPQLVRQRKRRRT
jgi:hypothetical protein